MEHENAVEELTENSTCNCHCNGECHCNHKKSELLEIFDENEVDRIVANLNDWD